MGFINLTEKTINAKLVYYGVGLGGKTTSLKVVHGMLCPNDEVKLVSINTEQDSTLLFDFLPIDLGQVEGFKIRIQGFTVPGQQKYVVMRKYVLQGADAVVLVVDSREKLIEDNLQSIEDLKANLEANGLDWNTIPLVIQYNKQDLPDLLAREKLDEYFRFRDVPVFETIAPQGVGVFEAFTEVVGWMVEEKVQQYGLGRGKVDPKLVGDESRQRLLEARKEVPEITESLVRVAIPEDAQAGAQDLVSPESLAARPAEPRIDEASIDSELDELFSEDSSVGADPARRAASEGTSLIEGLFDDLEEDSVGDTAAAPSAPDVSSGSALSLEDTLGLDFREEDTAETPHVDPAGAGDASALLGQAISSNLELAELYCELADYKGLLEKKNRELVEANQLISHDLKKPLTVFKSVLHLLRKEMLGPLNDKQRDALENCTESVAYMEELVADILDSSRLDYDGVEFEFEDIDITMLVGSLVRRLRYDLDASGVRMRVEPLPVVKGDRAALTKVFMNLIGNAINYRDPDKDECEVRVLAEDLGDAWFVRVQDNGLGIPETCRESIFEKFQRGSNTGGLKGTGLGLYICQQMVRGHGGELFVESEVGVGTSFVVKLPKEPTQATHSPVA